MDNAHFNHFTSEHYKVSKSEVFRKVIPAANFRISADDICQQKAQLSQRGHGMLRVCLSVVSFNIPKAQFLPAIRSLERRAGYLVYCMFFCLFGQRFLDNSRADSRQSSHAGVLWFRMCLLPFWGLAAPNGREKGQMKFSLLWESMGNFCILAVFERYLSNACTDPHQILFV